MQIDLMPGDQGVAFRHAEPPSFTRCLRYSTFSPMYRWWNRVSIFGSGGQLVVLERSLLIIYAASADRLRALSNSETCKSTSPLPT